MGSVCSWKGTNDMLFYEANGKKHKARSNTQKPKFLRMKDNSDFIITEKTLNDTPILFYHRENHPYIHFCFRNEWFKFPLESVREVEHLYDADHLLLLHRTKQEEPSR